MASYNAPRNIPIANPRIDYITTSGNNQEIATNTSNINVNATQISTLSSSISTLQGSISSLTSSFEDVYHKGIALNGYGGVDNAIGFAFIFSSLPSQNHTFVNNDSTFTEQLVDLTNSFGTQTGVRCLKMNTEGIYQINIRYRARKTGGSFSGHSRLNWILKVIDTDNNNSVKETIYHTDSDDSEELDDFGANGTLVGYSFTTTIRFLAGQTLSIEGATESTTAIPNIIAGITSGTITAFRIR